MGRDNSSGRLVLRPKADVVISYWSIPITKRSSFSALSGVALPENFSQESNKKEAAYGGGSL